MPRLTEAARKKAPGLAVRRTGRGVSDLRVALAWGDGVLRLWDVAARARWEVADGRPGWNDTAAFSGGRLVTGGLDKADGYLRPWQDDDGGKPAAGKPQLLGNEEHAAIPRALCALPGGGGTRLLAAVYRVMDRRTKRNRYELAVLSDGMRPKARAPLWDLTDVRLGDPILTASPDGRFLAVAGSRARSVRVYQLAGLPDAEVRLRPLPPLRGVGTPVRSVAFARKGKALGLFLSAEAGRDFADPPGGGAEGALLDFAGRRLTRDAEEKQGWAVAGPAGWSVQCLPAPGRKSATLEWSGGGGGMRVPIPLRPGEEVTAQAVVPPRQGVTKGPVLAVATWRGAEGEPVLTLYRAETGVPLRELRGHAQRINALAVSPDGRFLASAAEDETVCLWHLTDLNQILGKHGTLTGLSLKPANEGVRVTEVREGSPAAGALKAGDVITAVGRTKEDARPVPVLSPLEFYRAVWDDTVPYDERDDRVARNQTAWLRVLRDGGAKVIGVPAGQGVDERTPSLTLFVTPAGGKDPRWVAWSLFGPYDSSDREVERYVGWQYNPAPDQLDEPIPFAELGEFKKFYDPGLLRKFAASADPQDFLGRITRRDVPPPQVRIDAVACVTRTDDHGQYLVRRRRADLRFTIVGPSLAEQEVRSVAVTVDRKAVPPPDLKKASGQTLSVGLDLPPRKVCAVRIDVQTAGDPPRTHTEEVWVRYQPEAPGVDHVTLGREDGTFRAAISPAKGQAAVVTVAVNGAPAGKPRVFL
ncbi:MAG TPA: hypothetical protein VJ739_11745 [Gemmataceae bacterium]|nr:hypothetical protein [Gemmataceae bacterium]